jgi:REP element-mobilizing transposase RayT
MKIEYNNLYTHFVLVTEKRTKLITSTHRERIEKYITGIVNNNNCKMYAIYANPEHVHFLISRSPAVSEEYIATVVANSSGRFITDNKLCPGKFAWQQSASAFSVSKKDIDHICQYILNQHEHHRVKTFDEEYNEFLHEYQKTLKPKIRE